MDYSIEVLRRLSLLGDGRRPFLDDSIVESNIKFASDFIITNKLDTATQQMIDEAIIELAVHRCLISISTMQPGNKDVYSRVINEHKNVLAMVLSGVIPEDLIASILEDQTSKKVTSEVSMKTCVVGKTRNMISDFINHSYYGRLI